MNPAPPESVPPEPQPIRRRVVIVDDHAMFRQGVIAALGDAVDVVGQADDVDAAVRIIEATEPEVVLLDVHLTSGSGADVITKLRERGAAESSRFLALSVSDAPDDVLGLVRAGAQGYVTKRIESSELVDAIEHVAVGNAVFSPRLAAFVLEAFRDSTTTKSDTHPPEDLDLLSPREQEVMRLLARGFLYKEIAAELYISNRTVESHASSVLRKLQLSSRHELTHWAARHHLL